MVLEEGGRDVNCLPYSIDTKPSGLRGLRLTWYFEKPTCPPLPSFRFARRPSSNLRQSLACPPTYLIHPSLDYLDDRRSPRLDWDSCPEAQVTRKLFLIVSPTRRRLWLQWTLWPIPHTPETPCVTRYLYFFSPAASQPVFERIRGAFNAMKLGLVHDDSFSGAVSFY